MRRIQPFHYIVILAGLFILTGLILFSLQLLPSMDTADTLSIDPVAGDQDNAIYDLWFSSAEVYDLSIDHGLNSILLSADNNAVTLLNRERKLLWEKVFTTAPQQAKISSCGNYAIIGTTGGRVFFTTIDQQYWWDHEGSPVDLLAVSPNASWIAVARSKPDQDLYHLDFFDKEGTLKWSIETGPIMNLYLTSEYLEQANIYYTSYKNEQPVITAVNLEGEELWSYEGQVLAAVSKHGSRLAVLEDNRIIVYDSLGYALWATTLPFEANSVVFNPQNYNRILVYGSREGSGENFYYFDLAEDLLWMRRVADGSLFSFTADGQYIVTSSWRHYKEDFTQMFLLDRDGVELNSWEVAMRVERLNISGHPYLAVVCSEDSYIDMIDLRPLFNEGNGNGIREAQLYNPVTTGFRPDETRITLYFADENANMIPVTRSISLTDDPLQAVLEELVRGPARGSSLYRTIPDKDFSIETIFNPADGSLVIDLSPELGNMGGFVKSKTAFESLIMTVSAFNEVKEIYLNVGNELIETFGEGILLEQPLAPHRWKKPVYIPVMSGNRYYLLVREGADETTEDVGLQDLVGKTLLVARALPFVPADLELIRVHQTAGQVQINLNGSLRAIFPEDPTEKERMQAALVLDALFMTVFGNSRSQRVEIMINGQPWNSPAGYPSTSRFFRQPYFINPEQ
ncbi:MAG: GerMN domain-containing protein [Bacillota bacterium]